MTDQPPAWPPHADRPPPDVWPPLAHSAPPDSMFGYPPTAETPAVDPTTIDPPTAETPIVATRPDDTSVIATRPDDTPTATVPAATATDDDTPTATVPAFREQVLEGSIVDDDDRTWHTPIPESQHFHPAHEANWPAQPGQQQWLPETHHDEQWHPQHEQPPAERHHDEPDEEQPRGRRTALWVSLALVFTLLLCGGGAVSAYLLLRNADGGGGAPDPATAVTRFLSAVYSEQDPGAANELLCRESRDTKKMTAKVDEVRGYSRTYDGPQFRWAEPAVSAQQEKRATVAVDLTMTTRDEKTAQQRLTFTVVRKTGWWVCEVTG